MNERIIHSVTLEAKLRKAIDTEALLVHYQPKVATTDGSIVGMEALLRYDDPDEGLVFPGTFIPLMEETGMINEIGAWVMRQAAEDVEKWRRMNLKPPRIAVNVSPVQLRQKNFLELVEAMIPGSAGDHGLDIEITESAVMADISENIPKLAAVRERGFSIAVDDFGTGYSSLNYLSRLPVDTLKIDRSFIIDMTEHPNSLSIVTTIITLAHALDLKVVAEGVDDEEQAKLLRLLRCDQIQGNLCSRPLSWEEITSRLHEKNSCIIQPRSRPSPYP
jgi:EAL domain-containing protein (putative c-di-GMP-specific phosphodiesterase class I)